MRARAVAAIALSGALALGLSGCTMWMHVETSRPYNPSDGENFTVGDLELRNVLVVTEDGELGNLVGTAVNLTGSDIDFTVQWKTDGSYYEVELTADANGRTTFGVDKQVTLEPLGEPAGSLLDVVVHLSDTQKGVRIPVLDATLAEYEDAIPTPTPTPTPVETSSTEPDAPQG
ncbi:MAG: DNA modification methylase [Protaetiibacter sp.]